MLDRLPGQENNRQVFVLHNDYLYQLTFLPMDEGQLGLYHADGVLATNEPVLAEHAHPSSYQPIRPLLDMGDCSGDW